MRAMTSYVSPPKESCDVCGLAVDEEDFFQAEMNVAGAMCPIAMTFHKACYEKATEMWEPDPDSYCTVDNEFPETQQWVLPEQAQSN